MGHPTEVQLPPEGDRTEGDAVHASAVRLTSRDRVPLTYGDAILRLEEAEDTLRAIGLGEVDAFVVSDGSAGQRVFTLSTADLPYRRFVENMRDGAATVSPAGVILYANRRLADLLSCSSANVLGARLTSFMSNDAIVAWESVRGSEAATTVELDLVDVAGEAIPVLLGFSPLGDDGDLMTCLTFTDLSAQKAQDREIARLGEAQADRLADLQHAQAALTKQATHDALTGLPNRELLVDRIDRVLQQAARAHQCTAVFFIDLDGFKHVNDTRGHAVGNRVLRGVARRLLTATRDMDTVARVGGDEFVILAPAVSGHQQAVELGARLVQELERGPSGASEGIRASIGIAVSESGRGDAELLIHEADIAMYSAKSLGGTRSVLFDGELAFEVQARAAAQANLQAALDDGRVVPHYQPIVDLETGAVAGFEALARLVERDGTVLEPSSFIAVAEISGLVLELGAQVLEQACAQCCLWSGAPAADGPTIAVNVSSRQLDRGDLVMLVRDILARTGLAPLRLHLELTETAIMDLHPEVVRQLTEVRGLGVQIGLDDFGTGYASLTHLRRLPLDFVKVDRSFVQGLGRDPGDERIVSAVIDLARNLGLRSIGEGVETFQQLERLRALGCDQAQGYLLARPAAPEDLSLDDHRLTAGPPRG